MHHAATALMLTPITAATVKTFGRLIPSENCPIVIEISFTGEDSTAIRK